MRVGRAQGGAVIASAVSRVVGAFLGDDETRLTPESLFAEATQATRLDPTPFGDPNLIEALTALLSSLKEEASLSPFGLLAAGWDLKRMLSTLLILADAEREDRTNRHATACAADLRLGVAAQRHHVPARIAGGGSRQPGAAHMGGDLPLPQASVGRLRSGPAKGAVAARHLQPAFARD
jgi:hypothetical protein